MCFAPQRRALFRHVNFQKWSDTEVLCTFWLGNLPTTACNCSSLIWPDGSAPAALASLLFDPPEPQIIGKTCDFSTFLRACICSFFWLFLVSDILSFFFFSSSFFSSLLFSSLLFSSLLFLFSSLFFSSLLFSPLLWLFPPLLFSSVHIVGSLTSKLPSGNGT